MKAIVLVAGYAVRLYPLTENKPKALLTLNNKTLLDYLMDKVEEVDVIDEVILVSNEKFYDQFVEWSNTYIGSKKITVLNDGTSTNDTRLGAIGDTQFAIDQLNIKKGLQQLATLFILICSNFKNGNFVSAVSAFYK